MKLIIAEKPSLARTVAKALGKYENHAEQDRTGYVENENYIITWCMGHLLSLKDVDDYLGKKTPWKEVELPFVPNSFEYKIKDDDIIKKQVSIIKNLIEREGVKEIIHCGDSDREGQIIVDSLLAFISNDKTVMRYGCLNRQKILLEHN